MLSVLFWNLNGKRRESLCANLARRHNVTLLVLAECSYPDAMRKALNRGSMSGAYYPLPPSNPKCRLHLFSRLQPPDLPEVASETRYRIHRLSIPNVSELLLVAVHANSDLLQTQTDQNEDFRNLALRIAAVEDQQQHTRTLLIGDLNAQPFARRVASAVGLNAVMARRSAVEEGRRVLGNRYRCFYNPMWRFFGQPQPSPPGVPPPPQGTYYYRKAIHDQYHWYLFDQVLLRPALLPYFRDEDVEILTGDLDPQDPKRTSFQRTDGTPNGDTASDHFPILVRLDYPGV